MFNNDEIKQLESLVKNVVSTELKTELQPLKEDVSDLKKFAKRTDKKLKQIHDDQNQIIKHFDERNLELAQKIEEVQDYLHLPKAS